MKQYQFVVTVGYDGDLSPDQLDRIANSIAGAVEIYDLGEGFDGDHGIKDAFADSVTARAA